MSLQSKETLVPQNPIILRCHRLMEAFAKSDDERDFYLDKLEGFIVFFDLDKSQEELDAFTKELQEHPERYVAIPKLTFYEIKKLMEGFVNEKVYDIDTKEKLLDIIQSKNARDNFLEYIYDHHMELEKWQQYYQEKFRIRLIEWLRNHKFDFVFEEDIELTKSIVEKVKINMFTPKAMKDILQARKILADKAQTYYSNEALNPRPKRGRPPKQIAKVETEPQFSLDITIAVPKAAKPLLFAPDYHSSSVLFTFSDKFASEADLLAHRKNQLQHGDESNSLKDKLQALRAISSPWIKEEGSKEVEVPQFSEPTNLVSPKPTIKKTPFSQSKAGLVEEKKHPSVQKRLASDKSTIKPSAPAKKTSEKKPSLQKKASPAKLIKKPIEIKKDIKNTRTSGKARLRPLVKKIRKK